MTKPQLKPRKSPVQARSNASVEAIREATIQVLLAIGKERLTTTKVARRAGVSVGTLYQYFPNKSSLLQAVLREHMQHVFSRLEATCEREKGASPERIADTLVNEYLDAKLESVDAGRALYYVSDDVGGAEIVRELGMRSVKTIAALLESSGATFTENTTVMALTVLAAISGVTRRMVETGSPPGALQAMREGVLVMVRAYVNACVVR